MREGGREGKAETKQRFLLFKAVPFPGFLMEAVFSLP